MKKKEKVQVEWEDANWEQITENHAEAEQVSGRADIRAAADNPVAMKRELFADFYEKLRERKKDRVAVASAKYAMLAIGLTAVTYLVRDMQWLAITLGAIALVFGLISAYGIGKCQQM